MAKPQWSLDPEETLRAYNRLLIKEGMIVVDEFGEAQPTEKGKKELRRIISKLKPWEEILYQVGLAQEHGVPISMDI